MYGITDVVKYSKMTGYKINAFFLYFVIYLTLCFIHKIDTQSPKKTRRGSKHVGVVIF